MPESRTRRSNHGTRRFGIGEIGFSVAHAVAQRAQRIRRFGVSAPGLRSVVRRPALRENIGTSGNESPHDGEADPGPPTDTRDKRDTSGQPFHEVSISGFGAMATWALGT